MSDRPLPALEALGEQFQRLGDPAPRRITAVPRALVIVLAVTLLLAGVATAAILITRGAPLPAPRAADLQSSGVPLPGSARLAGLAAPDPDAAAPPWDLRLSRTAAGETCTAVGEVLGGQFGIVGLDHVFRALPLGGVDSCGVAAPGGPVLAGARVFLGAGASDARTVVNGVAGAGTRSVTAYGPGGARALHLGPQGSFLTVYRGYVEDVRPRIVVVSADGHRHTIAFAQSAAFEVADPGGGSPWTVSGDPQLSPGAYPDENCAQATRELGRNEPSQVDASLTPEVCGRLGAQPVFVAMRRFVPGSGARGGYPWGNNPARTLVYGAASPRVASLSLSGAGARRVLSIDAHGGVFLAVLDGHVDPRALVLSARLRDGRALTYARSTNLLDFSRNRPLPEPPVPAYRDPLPAAETALPAPSIPIASTVRDTLRAADPAGGPQWALRSWQGRPNPRASFGAGYSPSRLWCAQVGVRAGRALVSPHRGAHPAALTLGQDSGPAGGGCTDAGSLARFGPSTEVRTFVADPYAYAPRPLRTVVIGLLRAGATHPMLLGAGAPRRLPTDANHAFLLVLPGRFWDAPLRVSAIVAARTVVFAAQPSPGAVPPRPQARAPDPDGGAPWGFAYGANGSSAYGRIVDGRFAYIDPTEGTMNAGPQGWGGGGTARVRRAVPAVSFDVQGDSLGGLPGEVPPGPTPPQVERRTLAGTTVITGKARPDVLSVTIVTPRDVRTVRPNGPQHVFIVVYDGQFFRGALTATVRLRNGRTVSEALPGGPAGIDSAVPATPSLTTFLRGAERQLVQLRHEPGGRPARGQRGGAIADLTAIVAVIERRIAYQRAHPGVLPVS